MSAGKLVYSTDATDLERSVQTHALRTTPPAQNQTPHARRYISAMYDASYVRECERKIAWLKALTAERHAFKRLPAHTQDAVNAWWTQRCAAASRFEGGADVAEIQESLTQRRYALEAALAARTHA